MLRFVGCSRGGRNTEAADRPEVIYYPLGCQKYAAIVRDQSVRGPGPQLCLHRATPIDTQTVTANETAVVNALRINFFI